MGTNEKLLNIKQVCELANISKPTVYRKVKNGSFPAPIKIPTTAGRGPKMVNRWQQAEILEHCLRNNAKLTADQEPWYEYAAPFRKPWVEQHKHSIMAVIAGVLSGLAVWLFR